ncbi:MAG TPA: hypothetical protein DIW47_03030 [Bacteroidetes bacterium]|nr:hypothetical protein [Bacteroidota bacterium]
MADRLFSSGNKSRILAIENLESDKLTISKVAETLGFQVNFCKDDQEALTKLQQRFYQIIIVNPELSGEAVSRFIGDLRSIRGYERIPILVIAPEHLAMYASNYLDEGADGYLLKPFNEDLLFSHLNLFLRRQIFRRFHESEFLKRDLNTERGQIILCSDSKQVLDIPIHAIETEVIVVNNESELFKTLFSKNIWIVLLGAQAKWALPLVGKIKNDEAFNVQVILLRTSKALDAEVVDFFNQGGDDITSINKPEFILSRQINSRIERELYYKEKYITALTTAASKLPIRSENRFHLGYGDWDIEAFHEYHDQIPGGDFYEAIAINENQRVLIIGDVMGKKWDAWFFSLAYLGYIRSTMRNVAYQHFVDPAKLLMELNDSIFRDFKLSEVFTTLSVALLSKDSNEILFASAGGLPALVHKKSSGIVEAVQAVGTLLGLNEHEEYKNTPILLETGDTLLLFTDGYLENNNSRENLSTMEILAGHFKTHSALSGLEKLDDALRNAGTNAFEDDRTMIRITYKLGNS